MNYGLNKTAIEKISDVFEAHPDIDEAIIYGSRAIGTYREGSDIDITLKGNISFESLLGIERELDDLMLPYTFDISRYETIKNNDLLDHIQRVGKVFYKKLSNIYDN